MMIRISPSQKSGMAWPAKEKVVTKMSKPEYWRTAERIPAGMAISKDTSKVVTIK